MTATPKMDRVRVGMRLRMSESWRRWRQTLGMDSNEPQDIEEVFGSVAAPPQPTRAESIRSVDSMCSSIPPGLEKLREPIAEASSSVPPPPPVHGLARGTRNECKALDSRVNRKGDAILEPSSKPFIPTADLSQFTIFDEYCLIVTREFDRMNTLLSTTLKIQSPYVMKALRDVVKYYPDCPVDVSDVITVGDPPALIYHYRKELQAYAKRPGMDENTKLHISYVMAYLQVQIGAAMEALDKHLARGLIKHEWLWMIFRPGDLVYSPKDDELYYFKKGEFAEGLGFSLSCYCHNYDGTGVGRDSRTMVIPSFGEARELFELPIIPLKLFPDPESVKKRLALRGKRFLELRGVHSQQHKSVGRVVVDCKTYREKNTADAVALLPQALEYKECKCVCAVCKKLTPETPADYNHELRELSFDDLILCRSTVQGFSLARHRWMTLKVDDLSEVAWKENAIDGLVIEEKQKQVVMSLATSRIFLEGQSGDVIDWKGKGLVVLLHGEPGTGKTLTAECVCERLKRPLYIVNGGELGTSADFVQTKLKEILALSARWNAIVLIDEADVFLESRVGADVHRNSLVSVFLRELEYFSGMLFLTTNRISSFDSAFTSRIHVALHYASLTATQRHEVWVNAIKRLPSSEVSVNYYGEDLKRLAMEELNGRVISYAVRTAKALAEGKGEKLNVATLRDVVGVYKKFSDAVAGKSAA